MGGGEKALTKSDEGSQHSAGTWGEGKEEPAGRRLISNRGHVATGEATAESDRGDETSRDPASPPASFV